MASKTDILTVLKSTTPPLPKEPLTNITWFAHARKLQYYFYQFYSPTDYDRYNINKNPMLDELKVLMTKICFLRYGPPRLDNEQETHFKRQLSEPTDQSIKSSSNSNYTCPYDYYTTEQRKEAEKLANVIVGLKNPHEDFVDVCILFLCFWKPLTDNKETNKDRESAEILPVPFFRIGRSAEPDDITENVEFVDFEGTIYSGMERYMRFNHLPPGALCFPGGGYYGMREAARDETFTEPADGLRVHNGITPVGHSFYKFIDVDGKLSIGPSAVTGDAAESAVDTSIIVSPVVSAGTANISGITAKEKKPSPSDIMNVTLKVLMSTHSVVNFKTANAIIEEASQSLDAKKSEDFERILSNLSEPNIIKRNNRTVRIVKHVDSARD